MALTISSLAFENGGTIPSKYTCDGENMNPPLEISEIPESAKSLALIMDDPDIPDFVKEEKSIEVFDHWVVFNLPAGRQVFHIEEGAEPEGIAGANSSGENKYTGPCPPDKEHRYFFKLYALDTELDLPLGSSKEKVERAMEGRIIAQSQLIGKYKKQNQ